MPSSRLPYAEAPLIVLADVAVIMVMRCAQSRVVPAAAISAGTTWMLPLASTAVLIPQLAFRPVFSLPVAGVVAVVYTLTVPHPAGASFLVVQAVVTAALMTLVRRGGRSADAVITSDLKAEQEIRAEAARRADEKEQYRQLHNTILSTLTMIASGAFARPSPILSTQAPTISTSCASCPRLPGPVSWTPRPLAIVCGRSRRMLPRWASDCRSRQSPCLRRWLGNSRTAPGKPCAMSPGTQGRMRRRYGSAARVTAFLLRSGTGGEGLICCRCLVAAGHQGVHLRADVGGRRERRGDEPARCGHHGRLAVARVTARQPSAVLAAWYARALDVAAVIVVVGWHIGGAGSLLVAHLGDYGSDLFQAIAWSVLALEIAAGAIRLLRGSAGRGPAWALAVGALAISTAVAATCPPGRMLETNWA